MSQYLCGSVHVESKCNLLFTLIVIGCHIIVVNIHFFSLLVGTCPGKVHFHWQIFSIDVDSTVLMQ